MATAQASRSTTPRHADGAPTWGQIRLEDKQWSDPLWRLSNLYRIVDDEGREIEFRPNDIQLRLYREDLWYLLTILKSRQHGTTTWLTLVILDQCVFRANMTAGIIAHTVQDAQKIFRNKVQFPYQHLPVAVREAVPLMKDSQSEFVLANGSNISVGTSYRSGTLQFLLVSEFGKISRKYPDKAVEIVTGSFNTVKPGQFIWVESTAEGRGGAFYQLTKQARALAEAGQPLSELDFRFAFYAWWEKRGNVLDPEGVTITKEMRDYFAAVEAKTGAKLDDAQRAWYVKKREQMMVAGGSGAIDGDGLMKREHPSYPDEAFEAAVEGSYYAKEMLELRRSGRLRSLPVLKGVPVDTLWDIGRKDRTSIGFVQKHGPWNHVIDYYANAGEEVEHYVAKLQEFSTERGYVYAKHYLPHDAKNKHAASPKSYEDRLYDLGYRNTEIVERVEHLGLGIQALRTAFPTLIIDPERCADLVEALDNYRKAWNDTVGDWYDHPVDDEYTHAADMLRQGAQVGLFSKAAAAVETERQRAKRQAQRRRSWRTR